MNIHKEREKVEELRTLLRKVKITIDRVDNNGAELYISSAVKGETTILDVCPLAFRINGPYWNEKIKDTLCEFRETLASQLFDMEEELREIEKEQKE